MKTFKRFAAAAVLLAGFLPAARAYEIDVTPWLAPNVFGSPNFAAAEANAVQAMYLGVASYGTPNTPAYFQANANVTASEGIVTGFPSWMGHADPGTVYGPAFANELGNRMTFAVAITRSTSESQFSISQLSFAATSTDPGDALGFSFATGNYGYGSGYLGVLYGADGKLGGGDDAFITSGANTQLVDAIFGRGSGNSFAAYCAVCSIADQQAAIDQAAADAGGPFSFTGVYSLGSASGSGTFEVAPVPLPAAAWLLLSGLSGVAAVMRRRNPARGGTAARH